DTGIVKKTGPWCPDKKASLKAKSLPDDENKRIWSLKDQISSLQLESELNMLELERKRQAIHQVAKRGCHAYAYIEFGQMEKVQIYKRREPTSMKLKELDPVNYDESTDYSDTVSSAHYDTFAYKYEDQEEECANEIGARSRSVTEGAAGALMKAKSQCNVEPR
ncbi:14890_t:CDS:2, partial [Dentiscutata erythropus]